MVGVGDQVSENVQNLGFEIAGEVVVTPSLANEILRIGAVAFQQQRASQRKLALRGERLVQIRADGLRIEPLLPECRLRTSAQQTDIRPARIVRDEGNIASEVNVVVVAAQDRPLDHVAGDGIAHTFFYIACLRQLALARQRDCSLDRGESGGIGGHGVRFLIGATTGSIDLQDDAQDAHDRERH